MIYFLRADGSGHIKIGHTIRLAERIRGLQAEVRDDLRLLGITDGGFDEERAIHRRFDHLRLEPTHKCEWFRASDELLEFIARVGREWDPGCDAPPDRLRAVLILRGTEEWKAWLDKVAEANGAPLATTIEQALKAFGIKLGVRPAPRRTGGR